MLYNPLLLTVLWFDAVDPLFRIGQVRALPGMMYELSLIHI